MSVCLFGVCVHLNDLRVCACLWLCVAVCGCAWLCVAVCGSVFGCVLLSGFLL